MAYKWVPRFSYNAGTILTLTYPQRFWEPEEGIGMGDEDVSASGVPESYWVRYDQACGVTIRFLDSERVAVMTMLEWMVKNKGTAWFYRFDAANAGTEYSVYLETPRVGDRIKPRRDTRAPWLWELDLLIRSSNGTRIHQALPLT